MLVNQKRTQGGETLVEVLLAFAVFSLAFIVIMRTMDLGTAKILVSNERSQTQAIVNGQIALLRAAHDKAARGTMADWTAITSYANTSAATTDGCTPSTGYSRFGFTANDAAAQAWTQPQTLTGSINAPTEGAPSVGSGVWIEAKKVVPAGSKTYYDFFVKACWYNKNQQQLKTVVRLYEI